MLKIKKANQEIDTLTEQKYSLEAEYRALEAEVGPIKYIAEFVYGEEADRDLLEEAVRWVIIILIVVFDPLAVLLLIASQYTFEFARPRKTNDEDWKEYEKARAEKIIANPGYVKEEKDDTESIDDPVPESKNDGSDDGDETRDDLQEINVADNESNGEASDEPNISERETVEKNERQVSNPTPLDAGHIATGYSEAWDKHNTKTEPELIPAEPDEVPEQVEKKESSSEDYRLTEEDLDALDELDDWKEAKQKWKIENPGDELKNYKIWYLQGKIDNLPWEKYLKEEDTDLKKKILKRNQE